MEYAHVREYDQGTLQVIYKPARHHLFENGHRGTARRNEKDFLIIFQERRKESQFFDQLRLPFLQSPLELAIVIRKQDIAIDGKIDQFRIARSDGSPFDDLCHITNLPNHVVKIEVPPGSDVRRGQAP